MSNPRVYMDVSINGGPPERMVIELFADVMPRTAENFRAICVGSVSTTGKFLHYKGRVFSHINKGHFALGGLSKDQHDTSDLSDLYESIYGTTFPVEDCEHHSGPGILMMASRRPDKVGSRFILAFCRLSLLDMNVAFGKVIKGMDTVQNIEQAGIYGRVEITGCGEISDGKVSNVMESDKPQSSSVRKASEAKLQKDNDSKKYESSHGKLEATMKNDVLVTNDNDRELTFKKPSSNPNQHSYDLRKSSSSRSDNGEANRRRVVKDKRIPPSISVRKEEPEAKLQKLNISFSIIGNDREVQLSTNPHKHADDPSKSWSSRSDDGKANRRRVVKAKLRKEEPEAKLKKYNDSDKYESSCEKLEATCLPVTKGNDREVKPSANPNQNSGDPGEEMSNPRVYLEVSINGGPPERMVIELFANVVPKTAENFRAICVGSVSDTGKFLHYKGRVFSSINKGFFAVGGVSENQHDTGDESIYGTTFPAENCLLKHSGPGILMMSRCGPNQFGSRFLLTFCRRRGLDGHVFGKVIKGMDTVQNIEHAGIYGRLEITGCGEISDGKVSNVMESDKPQSSSVRKESEAKLQKDNDSKKYESSHGKLEATLKNDVVVTNDNDRELTSKKPSSNPNQHSYDLRKSRSSRSDDGKANRRRVVKAKRVRPSSSVRKEEPEAKLQKVNISFFEKPETQPWFFKIGNDREVQLSTNPDKHADDPSKSRYSHSPPSEGANSSGNLESLLGLRLASPRRSLSPSPHKKLK